MRDIIAHAAASFPLMVPHPQPARGQSARTQYGGRERIGEDGQPAGMGSVAASEVAAYGASAAPRGHAWSTNAYY